MKILVVAEHDNKSLKTSTLNTVSAAMALGGEVDMLIAGHNCSAVGDAGAAVPSVTKILIADNTAYAHQLAENVSLLIAEIACEYEYIIAPATAAGKNIMPRVAALLDVAQISDVTAIDSLDMFQRPIYAGNVIASVRSLDIKRVLTVRTTAFDAVPAEGGCAVIQNVSSVHDAGVSRYIGEEVAASDRPELTAASVIISGGRGMQNGDNFSLLEGIADKLNAAVGASRAAVDAGFVPNDYQVGQTGKIVAPDLYIAVGISGAIQHLAGMKDSKVIVAINKDEDAPIFQVADYGLVADLFQALPELEKSL